MAKGLLDTLEFETTNGEQPDVCLVRPGMYLIVYEGPDFDLWAHTVSIDSSGVITDLDSLELDTVNSSNCHAQTIQLSNGYAAVVYKGDDDDGYITTVSVDASGNIAVVQTWEYAAGTCWDPFIMNISGTTYVIATYNFGGSSLFTVTISATGVIAGAIIDTLALAVSANSGIQGIHISGDVWAFAYSRKATGEDIVIDTVEIDAAGNIGAAVIDTFNVTTLITAAWPTLIHVSGTIYACVYYKATDTSTQLFTIDIQNDGTIAAAVTDSAQVSASGSVLANIGLYDTNDFLVTRPGNAVNVAIADDGTIGAVTDSKSTGSMYWVRQLATATPYIWIIVYEGLSHDGFISTLGIMPEVTTQAVTNVVSTTATGNGNVGLLGIPSATQHGHCWNTIGWPEVSDDKTELGVPGIGAFTSNLNVLIPGTHYYVRAYVFNGDTVVYGNEVEFTTLALPAVTTDPVTDRGVVAITLNGTLDDDGGEACECGFEWGKAVPYTNTTPVESKTTGEAFSQIIAPLEPATVYHVRAFANNSAGTSYGADVEVMTYPASGRGHSLSRESL